MNTEFDRRSEWSDLIALPGLLNRIHFTKPGEKFELREGTEERPLRLPLPSSDDHNWGDVISMLEASEIIGRVSGSTFERLDHPALRPAFLDVQQDAAQLLAERYELRNEDSPFYRILQAQKDFKQAVRTLSETGNAEQLELVVDASFKRFRSAECQIAQDDAYRKDLTSKLVGLIIPLWPFHDDETRSKVTGQFEEFITHHELGIRDREILVTKADWIMREMSRLS